MLRAVETAAPVQRKQAPSPAQSARDAGAGAGSSTRRPDSLDRLKQVIGTEAASFVHHDISRVFVRVNRFIDGLFYFHTLLRVARLLNVLNSLLKD